MGFSLNTADLFLLVCFIPAIIGGLFNGLVRQAASLTALIAGICAGWHFSSVLAEGIGLWFKSESDLILIISFAIIFTLVLVVVNIIGKALSGIIKFALLGWLDKLLGILFGIAKYAFVYSILIYLAESLDALFHFLPQNILIESAIYPALKSLAPSVFPYIENIHF